MEYNVILGKSTRYSTITYKYIVIAKEENMPNIFFIYPELKTNENQLLLKPSSISFGEANNAKEYMNLESWRSFDYTDMPKSPEEYNLYIPKSYIHKNIEFKETVDPIISSEMLKDIKNVSNVFPLIVIGEDFSLRTVQKSYTKSDIREYICIKCKNTFNNKNNYRRDFCPHCNNHIQSSKTLVMKNLKEFKQNNYNSQVYSSETYRDFSTSIKERIYYMCKHPENDNGMIIYKICHEILADKDIIQDKYTVEYSLEHIVGVKTKAYKHLKKSKNECDPFEALNINTKNINNPPEILYENSKDFYEFAEKNEKFLRMCGFQSVLKYSSLKLNLEPFFIIFIGILNKYPVMEQIVKMGHAKLFFNLYKSILRSENKQEISMHVEKISDLVDNDAVSSKHFLRFPTYIGDFLIKKDANIDEYYYWRDIYEITKITKEQFENLIDTFNFAWINSQTELEDIGNILKFGYSIEKLFNYIMKQSKTKKLSVEHTIHLLTDYLNMCDLLQIEADKYPSDLGKIHDDMSKFYNSRKKMESDKILTKIALECESYVVPTAEEIDNVGIPKLFETMTVIFPKTETDFINEGNQQHNCVGSYPNNVRDGKCIIFFIRYKDTPDKSFITAECKPTGLGQCFYANNRIVNDEQLMKFANYIANKIKAGCSSGKIHGLKNIKGE